MRRHWCALQPILRGLLLPIFGLWLIFASFSPAFASGTPLFLEAMHKASPDLQVSITDGPPLQGSMGNCLTYLNGATPYRTNWSSSVEAVKLFFPLSAPHPKTKVAKSLIIERSYSRDRTALVEVFWVQDHRFEDPVSSEAIWTSHELLDHMIEEHVDNFALPIFEDRRGWPKQFIEDLRSFSRAQKMNSRYIGVRRLKPGANILQAPGDLVGSIRMLVKWDGPENFQLPFESTFGIKLPGHKMEPGNFAIDLGNGDTENDIIKIENIYPELMLIYLMHGRRYAAAHSISMEDIQNYTYGDRKSRALYRLLFTKMGENTEKVYKNREGEDVTMKWTPLESNLQIWEDYFSDLNSNRLSMSPADQEAFKLHMEEITNRFRALHQEPIRHVEKNGRVRIDGSHTLPVFQPAKSRIVH